jgi:hypothetical protein
MTNYFVELNTINVNDKTETKNGLTYLSWAYAWGEIKKRFPESTYTVYENQDGWNYFTDGKTAWVKTGVTVEGIEHIEYLPVMDFRNKSIPLDAVTSFDVNKTIQRSLTKAVARHGLGLYIYAGEDLPEGPTTVENVMQVFGGKELVTIEDRINNCQSEQELGQMYAQYKSTICRDKKLLDLVTEKGKELSKTA